MIKAIIFDCFGVLAEDGWLPLKRKYIGNNQALAQQISDLGKQNEHGFIDNTSFTKQAAELMGISEALLREATGKRVPNEELFDFIKSKLKPHYKIGLMSNANYDVLHQLFTQNQANCFDAAVTSFEVKLIKPDERMYELVSQRLGIEPGECLFVDDQERNCVAAEQVGMESVLYQNNQQFTEQIKQKLGLT
jgi:HAD superfamily hydrolase (TIGR01509 family)